MAYMNQHHRKWEMEAFANAFNDEKLYLVAYQWETAVTRPPWWAFWREPIVTRIKVQQPGRVRCYFEKGEDQFGNPSINIIKTDPISWTGLSKLHIVTEKGTEIAYLPCDFFEGG